MKKIYLVSKLISLILVASSIYVDGSASEDKGRWSCMLPDNKEGDKQTSFDLMMNAQEEIEKLDTTEYKEKSVVAIIDCKRYNSKDDNNCLDDGDSENAVMAGMRNKRNKDENNEVTDSVNSCSRTDPTVEFAYQVGYIAVQRDHFNFMDTHSFKVRFLFNCDRWGGPGYPILLYTGNEGDITNFWNNSGFVTDVLKKNLKAAVIFVEHRYFGRSFPHVVGHDEKEKFTSGFIFEGLVKNLGDVTSTLRAKMKHAHYLSQNKVNSSTDQSERTDEHGHAYIPIDYLSVEQAMADFAYFIEVIQQQIHDTGDMWNCTKNHKNVVEDVESGHIKKDQWSLWVNDHQIKGEKLAVKSQTPVVAIGGSYGGMLAAWMRKKYSHLVNVALASSAPLLGYYGNHKEYEFYENVTDSFQKNGYSPYKKDPSKISDPRDIVAPGVPSELPFSDLYPPKEIYVDEDLTEKSVPSVSTCIISCDGIARRIFHLLMVAAANAKKGDNRLVQKVKQTINICEPSESIKFDGEKAVMALISLLRENFGLIAMVNYPYPTKFLYDAPAWPVTKMCGAFINKNVEKLAALKKKEDQYREKMSFDSKTPFPSYKALDTPYLSEEDEDMLLISMRLALEAAGVVKKTACFNLVKNGASTLLDDYYFGYLACTTQTIATFSNGVTDLFPPMGNMDEYKTTCQKDWENSRMDTKWADQFGAKSFDDCSNIIFSRGGIDPWKSLGFDDPPNDFCRYISLGLAAHHLDLRAPTMYDSLSVDNGRSFEFSTIRKWLRAYYTSKKMASPL